MGFSVCSARFLVRSGGFLLWFLWKRNTAIRFLRNTAIVRGIKFVCVCVCVCKLDCKSFLNVFGLKNCKITIKKEKKFIFCWDKLSVSGLTGMAERGGFMRLIICAISC